MMAEGRKILRNLQRDAKLFVTKSVFASFLILSIGLTPVAYPPPPPVATTVLVAVELYLVVVLEAGSRRRSAAVTAFCLGLAALYVAVLAVPFSRDFFALAGPGGALLATAAGGAALAIGGLWLTGEQFVPRPATRAPGA